VRPAHHRRPGFKIFEAAVDDGSGSLRAVWLNQPYLRDIFMRGQHVIFYGAVEMRGSASLQLTNPQYESSTTRTAKRFTPDDRAGLRKDRDGDAENAAPSRLRGAAASARDVPDHLPEDIRLRLGLPSRHAALLATHFPPEDVPIAALNAFETRRSAD
jgi:ATP-dependent DNA helicase RecG